VLSRTGDQQDALRTRWADPFRGYPVESFCFPPGGLPELLQEAAAAFDLEATLSIGKERYSIRVRVQVNPASGNLSVDDELPCTAHFDRGDQR